MNGSQVFKPFMGSLRDWRIVQACPANATHLGTYAIGEFDGHPRFHGRRGHTSMIVSKTDCDDFWEIETLNSCYHLPYREEEPDKEFWNMS